MVRVGALEDGHEEPFLALEVVVDHPLGRAGARGDLVHARAREAVGRRTRAWPRRGSRRACGRGRGSTAPVRSLLSRHDRRFPCLCSRSSGMNVLVRTLQDKPNMQLLTTDTADEARRTRSASSAPASTPRSAPRCTSARPPRSGCATSTGCSTSRRSDSSRADVGDALGEVAARRLCRRQRHPSLQAGRRRAPRRALPRRPRARRGEHRRLATTAGAIGHNTDGPGSPRASARGLPERALDRVVVLGAGGAGAAVAHALLSASARGG